MENKNVIFEKTYLTVADIKSYLNISSTAAYELTHRKDFPTCKIGSSIRVPTELFLRWIDYHTHVPAELLEEKALNRKEALRVG